MKIHLPSLILLFFSSMAWANDPPKKSPCDPISISGYIDGSYNYLEHSNRFTSGHFNRAFDIEENGFTLQQAAVTVSALPTQGFGGLINIFLGRDAFSTAAFGWNPDIGIDNIGFDILQAYGQVAVGHFTVMMGKFNTLVGVEVVDPTNDNNYSRSQLFTFATPDTHTGVRIVYAPNDKWKGILGLNDGWDNIRDFDRGPTLEYQISYTPCPKFSLSAEGYSGIERVVEHTATGPTGIRNLLDLIMTYQVNDKITLAANYDYGTQENAFINQGDEGEAVWQGLAAYVNYQFKKKWALYLRAEDFSDRDGYRTGVPQNLKEVTLTLAYSPINNMMFHLETRRDYSNVDSFLLKHGNGTSNFQQSFALEVYYKFSNQ